MAFLLGLRENRRRGTASLTDRQTDGVRHLMRLR